ncbi:TetR/AcrR family transcriptional regulator [Enterovibrio sp. ZSDZ42]|uniref:TetR/AcrR family transcriptional regulator n=1 Tax=Enterovibrio gelatinilyticus TaxID=2899819 RepID=A0ABT5R713_9GAMM|nr:TetR/AcrR family transcriptional regulator [Enterovibrio sp. ZSDZ42]MDD1796059.1 TetR/AcrR family transcriptional regulator [Enterovibrio sp. ZSDZ42]
MNTESHSTRQHILDVGYQLIAEKGFSNVGLSQLLAQAGVPKGSFYHYFKSKEKFGEALIEDYFAGYRSRLDVLFSDPSLNGFDKMMTYWGKWIEASNNKSANQPCSNQRCLVIKLSAEVSDLSDAMRVSLLNGANTVIDMLANCIQQGVDDGSISVANSQKAAEQLYHMWIGAGLMSKLNQNTECLSQALNTTERLLKGDVAF